MKILLVDDDESILALLRQFLSASCGHDVTACSGGFEALDCIARTQEPFECFVLDIQMPQMDGIELCGKIRDVPRYAGTSIIMLTAMAQLDHLDRAFAAGANDYITKPFELGELRARIKSSQRFLRSEAGGEAGGETGGECGGETGGTSRMTGPDSPEDAPPGTQRESDPPESGARQDESFSEVVDIRNVDRVLGYTAFENYIMQLPRFGMFQSSVSAIRIVQAEQAHQICSPDQFRKLIHLVAGVISETMRRDNCFVSYRGAGLFLCIQNGRDSLSREDIEKPLNRRLQVALAKFPRNVTLELTVGKRHPLRWVTKAGTLKVLFNLARDTDDENAVPLVETPRDTTLVNIEHRRDASPGRQPYKSMLNEFLVEEDLSPSQLRKIAKGNNGS